MNSICTRVLIGTIPTSLLAVGLMSLAVIDTAAGKGTDNRASAPRAATATTTGVSPHLKAINQNKKWRGNKKDEP